MTVYTWDVLRRESGRLVFTVAPTPGEWGPPVIFDDEVAYCRETGEVVYLPQA